MKRSPYCQAFLKKGQRVNNRVVNHKVLCMKQNGHKGSHCGWLTPRNSNQDNQDLIHWIKNGNNKK
ncbi:MAG: hypothetical protein CMB80_07985 [Flammeovirgaceae bacterium]|nr:hypothetical protein [Flammeovirgaceae bacterium]